ncbi:cytochrome c oxidase assembly protein [Planococcus sp. 4-30]|uniref:cytochrome c oxidase assembly protein n=1 Tax=Planococcus sp. 4-30 TaxID=2874583 RepID=UPI001CBD2D37|nr:cytochrome c oxidase assembly protein [Planococcus sp. 4-30]
MEHNLQTGLASMETIVVILLFLAFLLYPLAAALTSLRLKAWPLHRYFLWSLGVFCIAAVFTGPLADIAHDDFTGHMWTHLLLGMLAPLLLLLAMPMTLLLRSLPISAARKVTSILKSQLFHLLSNPITAWILNTGGLYMLYMTDLYELMHRSLIAYGLIHLHVFLAGYLFTASILYIDVTSHRLGYLFRSVVLIVSLAAHKILSKLIYAYPPDGVPREQAEAGGMIMYYGGDFIDLVIIVIFCWQWYKATAPRKSEMAEKI